MAGGESVIIVVAGAGQAISTRPSQLVISRFWRGSAFGGVNSRSKLPGVVEQYMRGEFKLNPFISFSMGLNRITEAFDLMHSDMSIQNVIHFDKQDELATRVRVVPRTRKRRRPHVFWHPLGRAWRSQGWGPYQKKRDNPMTIENVSCNRMFGGWNKQYQHASSSLHCDMRFAIYLPAQASNGNKVPVLYWLSGLTCTDENFMHKAGAQRIAAELGMAIVLSLIHI